MTEEEENSMDSVKSPHKTSLEAQLLYKPGPRDGRGRILV